MPSQDFKYVQPNKKASSKNNVKVGAKGGKGGRIRVQAGDKRVPPSKSKPKSRKTVGPHEESTLNMESVQWSEQHYGVEALTQEYKARFPLMVRVTQGYYGELGTDVSIGQVIQIHSFGVQKRVVARDSQQQTLSIPLDYPVEVTLLERHDRVWMRLRDAVLSRPLPLRLRVMNTSHDAEVTTLDLTGEELTVTTIKEEVFLKGNSINDGWIDQVGVVLIPCSVHAAFSVAQYMRGASEEEWADFQGMYNRSVRHLNFTLMPGYSGIYVDGDNPYPLLDTVKPDASRSKSPDPPVHQLYENLPITEPAVQSPTSTMPIYDNLGYQNDETKTPVSHEDISPHFANAKDSDYSGHQMTVETDVHAPPRSVTPFSEVDESEVEHMFENVIQVGKETMERQQNEEREREEKKALEHGLYSNHIQSSLLRKSRQASASSDTEDTHNNNNHKSAKQLLNPPTPNREPPRGSYVSETSSGTPMGVIQPTVLQRGAGGQKPTAESSELGKPSSIISMEEVPGDITALTVEDVCQCLHLMNMDSHVSAFRTHQVDGKLLHTIKEQLLLTDFHFTPFNASKLMRFIRGWRPKVT